MCGIAGFLDTKHQLSTDLWNSTLTSMGEAIITWLRGPMRDWAESLLSTEVIKQNDFLNPDIVSQYWKEHLSGSRNHGNKLWDTLMFHAWLKG